MKTILTRVKIWIGELFHRVIVGRWNRVTTQSPGYTVILPIIPEFYPILEYNLRFLAECDHTHCDEILVVADSRFRWQENQKIVASYAKRLPVRYLVLPLFRRTLLKLHWVSHVIFTSNFVTAVKQCKSRYCYLHDGDFFLTDTNHIENLYHESERDGLNLLATYSRPYPSYEYFADDEVFPATYELMMRRDFLTSRPPYFLLAGLIRGQWHPTFTRFYREVRNETCRMRDTPGGDPRCYPKEKSRIGEGRSLPVGIHFKHLFNRIRAFEEKGRKFVDDRYAIFLLHALTSANACGRHPLFANLDEYFASVQVGNSDYFPIFERYFTEFLNQNLLSESERDYLSTAFEMLKAKIGVEVTTSDAISPTNLPDQSQSDQSQ